MGRFGDRKVTLCHNNTFPPNTCQEAHSRRDGQE